MKRSALEICQPNVVDISWLVVSHDVFCVIVSYLPLDAIFSLEACSRDLKLAISYALEYLMFQNNWSRLNRFNYQGRNLEELDVKEEFIFLYLERKKVEKYASKLREYFLENCGEKDFVESISEENLRHFEETHNVTLPNQLRSFVSYYQYVDMECLQPISSWEIIDEFLYLEDNDEGNFFQKAVRIGNLFWGLQTGRSYDKNGECYELSAYLMDQYSSIQKIRDTSDIFGQVGVETTSDFRTGILLSDEAIQLLSISAQQYLIECFKEAHFFSVDEKFIMTVEDSYAKLKKKKINFVLEAMKVINFEWDHDSILDVEKERNCCGNDYGETNLDHVACLSSREYLRAVRLVQERDSQNIKSFEIPECGENNPYFLKKEFQLESLVNHHYKDFDPYAKVGDIVQMLNDEENPLVVTERVYDEHGTRTPYIFELKSLKDEIITQELEVEDEYILDECYYLKREGTWAFTS